MALSGKPKASHGSGVLPSTVVSSEDTGCLHLCRGKTTFCVKPLLDCVNYFSHSSPNSFTACRKGLGKWKKKKKEEGVCIISMRNKTLFPLKKRAIRHKIQGSVTFSLTSKNESFRPGLKMFPL